MNGTPRAARQLEERRFSIKPVTVDDAFKPDLIKWLTDQANVYHLDWLLAHTENGVIWGKVEGSRLALSSDVFPQVSPRLRLETFHQARLFGAEAELLVWHDGDGDWQARLIDDGGTERQGWSFDEPQLQWGDHAEDTQGGFTLLADGVQGLRHAVPLINIPFDADNAPLPHRRPVRLGVRQYVMPDDDGLLVIAQGRLYGLWAE